MDQIGDYQLLEQTYKDTVSTVYKAERNSDSRKAIVRLLQLSNPSESDIARLKQEYEALKNNDNLSGLVEIYDVLAYDQIIAIVQEKTEALTLEQFINKTPVQTDLFLDISMNIAKILGKLHKNNIIHRDIKPQNIFIHPATQEVKLGNFGVSRFILQEMESIYNPEVIEGILKYVSPEQTGRMNRSVDYRCDLYCLGITFYEMLTGAPPFQSHDPMQLIHNHMASSPKPPEEVNPSVPKTISDIVLKLLAKAAEERYQNAFGLLTDLQECKKRLDSNGTIEPFTIGTGDISLQFTIPHIFVGRESEKNRLLASFERCAQQNRPEMVLVTGYSGIGKTYLVNELHKPITAKKGYFIGSKYDQLGKDVPYSAIIQAFNTLVKQILTENPESIDRWKKKILQALGTNGRVIIDVIPELALIIGDQPEVPELAPEKAMHRFQYVFKNFIQVFSHPDHPLVLFLDDLQWADYSSLNLLQHLLTDVNNGALFFIGAYRHNEIDNTHMLHNVINAVQQSEVPLQYCHIQPLTTDNIRDYLGKFLRLHTSKIQPLVEIVEAKTGGNPFFINQFLKKLHEQQLIEPDTSGSWSWDLQGIRSMEVTDNVIEFMAGKITELPTNTQWAMKIAASMGNKFDLKLMPMIMHKSLEDILTDFSPAYQEGLIYFHGDFGNFLHDRIQEAAYSLIPEKERDAVHYKNGYYMYINTQSDKLEETVFQIVNQLNAGISQILEGKSQIPKIELARLNLFAGKKAKNSAAYKQAFQYFQTGVSLLEVNDWENYYQHAYNLYLQAGETAYLNGDFDAMDNYLDTLLSRVSDLLDRIKAYEIRIQALTTRNKLKDAANTAREVFPMLGMELSDSITEEEIMEEISRTDRILDDKSDQDILDSPEMTDPYDLATMEVATSSAVTFYTGGYTNEIIIVVLKMMQLSLKKGLAHQSPYWFSCYAMTLFALDKTESAFRFADLALSMKNKFATQREIRTELIVYTFISHWKYPIKDVLPDMRQLYQLGMEVGDIEYSHLIIAKYLFLRYASGTELNELKEEIHNYNKSMKLYNMLTALNYNLSLLQAVENLLGHSEDPTSFQAEELSANDIETELEAANDQLTLFLNRYRLMQLNYLFGNIERAFTNAEEGKKYLPAVSGGMHHIVQFYFYRSLLRLASIQESSEEEQEEMLPKVCYAQDKIRTWAIYTPENLQHKIDLIEAELSRIKGDITQAETLYERAINGARENEYIHEQALAFELAAIFYHKRGLDNFARLYMSNAVNCYNKWGAKAKVAQIKNTYAKLLASPVQEFAKTRQTSSTSETSNEHSPVEDITNLDISTVIKASQAISEEIVLENLLKRLLSIGIENAGAERGALIFERNGELFVEAESNVNGTIEISSSTSLFSHNNLPKSVINYVFATGENVVLENASLNNQFSRDEYIAVNSVKSILCAPVQHQNNTFAVFYAENNLTTGVFTRKRLQILTILSAQAAISIQNAQLFKEVNEAKEKIKEHRDHLEEMVEERTKELRAAQQELIENAHRAGMADTAVGVLHNVGNVLNSIRTSIHSMQDTLYSSKGFQGLAKANQLLSDKMDVINDFIQNDPRGKKLLQYYLEVGEIMESEKEQLDADLKRLEEKNDMITNIISAQQTYASAHSMLEEINISSIINDALTMQWEMLNNHHIKISKYIEEVPAVKLEKTKFIHVLINIIRNAKEAMQVTSPENRELVISVYNDQDAIIVEIRDTGEGIDPENLDKIFSHGFTTKPNGHGFGLHSSANYMTEMGGKMWAENNNQGPGSRFILKLPLENRKVENPGQNALQ